MLVENTNSSKSSELYQKVYELIYNKNYDDAVKILNDDLEGQKSLSKEDMDVLLNRILGLSKANEEK